MNAYNALSCLAFAEIYDTCRLIILVYNSCFFVSQCNICICLGYYRRGYTFQDIAFHSDAGASPRDPRRPTVYVASNRGLVLRVNCQSDQIICAYQLHATSIRTLCIHSGCVFLFSFFYFFCWSFPLNVNWKLDSSLY